MLTGRRALMAALAGLFISRPLVWTARLRRASSHPKNLALLPSVEGGVRDPATAFGSRVLEVLR